MSEFEKFKYSPEVERNRSLFDDNDKELDYERSKRRRTSRRLFDLIRTRYEESREKSRLRKKLRDERRKLRKIRRAEKRRRQIGEKVLNRTSDLDY